MPTTLDAPTTAHFYQMHTLYLSSLKAVKPVMLRNDPEYLRQALLDAILCHIPNTQKKKHNFRYTGIAKKSFSHPVVLCCDIGAMAPPKAVQPVSD